MQDDTSKNSAIYDGALNVRMVAPDNLTEGMILAVDIHNIHGAVMVRAHTRITESVIKRIFLSGTEKVCVFNAKRDKEVSKFVIESDIDIRTADLADAFTDIKGTGHVPVDKLTNMVAEAVNVAESFGGVNEYLKLLRSKSEYAFSHSVSVGITCSMFAKWLKLSGAEQGDLVLSASLHDLGKLSIDQAILEKPGFLTDEEFEIIKTHPVLGVEFIREANLSENICLGVLEHHERPDGRGYPDKKTKESTSPFGSLISIADVYDALSSKRPYRDAMTPFAAMEIMLKESRNQFPAKELELFVTNIVNAYTGAEVELSDGSVGEIAYISSISVIRPIIRLEGGKMINLSYHPEKFITKVL